MKSYWRIAVMASLSLSVLLGSACTTNSDSRPQTPVMRDYQIVKTRIDAGGGVRLAGELTLPNSSGPFPAVVLISGSGPQDRDETIAGHKPLLVLSDHLTRNGFAVLRYDDRGVGKSSGNFAIATPDDFANDAAAAFRWLAQHASIDASRIGYLGHSEGAYIAPMAAKQTDAAYLVFLAGPAKPLLPDVLLDQRRDILQSTGATAEQLATGRRQVLESIEILRTTADLQQLHRKFAAYLKGEGVPWWDRRVELAAWATPWGQWYAAGYDPLPALRRFDRPVLALFGGSDLQVSAVENAAIMAAALQHPNSRVYVLPELNHLLQPSASGRIDEYHRIGTTMDSSALRKIVSWLHEEAH